MSALLRSNSGESELKLELVARQEYATDAGFEARLSIRGAHWDGDHTFPLSASVEGTWLRRADLEALLEHIAQWTRQPLEHLDNATLTRDFELARLPAQRLSICFGPRADVIPSLNPVVSIALSAGVFYTYYHFVTDQSCLRIFAEELSADLPQL